MKHLWPKATTNHENNRAYRHCERNEAIPSYRLLRRYAPRNDRGG